MNDDVEMQEQPVDIPLPQESKNPTQMGYGANTNDMLHLANVIYAEGAGESDDFMRMVGSSVISRMQHGGEFGSSPDQVIFNQNSPYYAVSKNSPKWQEALSQKFPDDESEASYKRAVQTASGLLSGSIGAGNAQFYFTPKEEAKLRKNPKLFDFSKVKKTGNVKTSKTNFNLYSYK